MSGSTWKMNEIRECDSCGDPFEAKRRGSFFCSKTCANRSARGASLLDPKPCEGCEIEFRPREERAVFCSVRCRDETALRRAAARTAAIQRHPLRLPCRECGGIIPEGRRMDSRYCGDTCLGAVVRRNGNPSPGRPAKFRIRAAAKLRVFERDGYVCQLCGDPVDRSAKWPDPESPVVDHWIPLALGGEHAPENWVTAHRTCNSMKKAKHPDEMKLRRPSHLLTEEVA